MTRHWVTCWGGVDTRDDLALGHGSGAHGHDWGKCSSASCARGGGGGVNCKKSRSGLGAYASRSEGFHDPVVFIAVAARSSHAR